MRLQPTRWESEAGLDSLRNSYFFSQTEHPSGLMNKLVMALESLGLKDQAISDSKMKIVIRRLTKLGSDGYEDVTAAEESKASGDADVTNISAQLAKVSLRQATQESCTVEARVGSVGGTQEGKNLFCIQFSQL